MERVESTSNRRHGAVGHERLAMLLALLWCALLVTDSLFAPDWRRPLWVVPLAWVVVSGILVAGAFVGEWLERAWRLVGDARRRVFFQLSALVAIIAGLEAWVLLRAVRSSWSLPRTFWNAGLGLLALTLAAAFIGRWVRQGRSWAPVSDAWLVVQGIVIVAVAVLAVVQLAIGW